MSTRPYAVIHGTADLRETADRLGSKMFANATMRFFRSRLMAGVHKVSAPTPEQVTDAYRDREAELPAEVGYFVTHDRNPYSDDGESAYIVRRYTLERIPEKVTYSEGEVIGLTAARDVIDFDSVAAFATRAQAMRYAPLFAATEKMGRAQLAAFAWQVHTFEGGNLSPASSRPWIASHGETGPLWPERDDPATWWGDPDLIHTIAGEIKDADRRQQFLDGFPTALNTAGV